MYQSTNCNLIITTFTNNIKCRRSRVTIAEKEALAEDTEEAIKRREAEAEERRRQSHDLVAESIRRELAESESDSNSQRILIISEEKEEEIPDVDDTDGVDPEAEFEAWRLRELGRIKKEKEEEVRREQEREEIERRRALPEAQRMKEDLEHASKLRDEKPKGQQKFLQKYWHKGAFHQVCLSCKLFRLFLTFPTGCRHSEAPRFHRSDRIYNGRINVAQGDASQKLWQAKSNKVHAFARPRYNCCGRWIRRDCSCQVGWYVS